MDKLIDLLLNCWKLDPPKLLISGKRIILKDVILLNMINFDFLKVTGGALNFKLKPRLRDVFRKGLIKAALSTSAWISSGKLS